MAVSAYEYFENRRKKRDENNSEDEGRGYSAYEYFESRRVDSDFIDAYINDTKKAWEDASQAYNTMDWNSAKSIGKTLGSMNGTYMSEDLRNRASSIRMWLNVNKGRMSEDEYNSFVSYLDGNEKGFSDLYGSFKEKSDLLSKFETEDDYNSQYAFPQKYSGKSYEEIQAEYEAASKDKNRSSEANWLKSYSENYGYTDDGYYSAYTKSVDDRLAEIDSKIKALKAEGRSTNTNFDQKGVPHNSKYIRQDEIAALESEKSELAAQKKRTLLNREGYERGSVGDQNSSFYDPEFDKYAAIGEQYYEDTRYDSEEASSTIPNWNFDQKGKAPPKEYTEWKDKLYSFEYTNMTDEERGIYHYWLGKAREEAGDREIDESAAERYVELITGAINARRGQDMRKDINDQGKLMQLAFSVYAGLESFTTGTKNFFSSNDEYIPQTATAVASQLVREDMHADGALWGVAYDVANNTAHMAPSLALGYIPVVGQGLGLAAMGVSAAGNAYAEKINSGYTKEQARAYSTLVGASEAGLSYLLGGFSKLGGKLSGNVISKLTSGVNNAFARTALKVGGNMVSEFTEEALQEVLNPFFENITLNASNDWSDVEWSQVAYSGLLGALSAGLLEGGGTIAGEVDTYKQGKAVMEKGETSNLVKFGKSLSADTVAYKLADKVNEKTGAYTIGRLLHEAGADSLSETNIADIEKSLVRKGVAPENASTIATWLNKAVEGGSFTKSQRNALENNEVISQTFKDVILNQNSTVNQRMLGAVEGGYLTTEQLKKLSDNGSVAGALASMALENRDSNTSVENEIPEENVQPTPEAVDTTGFAMLSDAEVKKRIVDDPLFAIAYEQFMGGVKSNAQAGKSTDLVAKSAAKEVDVDGRVSEDGKTTRISTGEAVTIDKSNPIAKTVQVNGKEVVYFNTDQGKVEVGDISYANESEGLIYEAFTDLSPAIANAAIKAYDGSMPVKDYIAGMREGILIYGKNNFQAVGKDISSDSSLAKLSAVDQALALDLGRKVAEIETTAANNGLKSAIRSAAEKVGKDSKGKPFKKGKVTFEKDVKATTDKQKAAVAFAEKLAEVTGIQIVFYDSKVNPKHRYAKSDGASNSTTIWLDMSNSHQDAIAYTLSHEFVHFAKKWSKKEFKVFADFMVEQFAEHGKNLEQLVADKMVELKTNDWDFAFEEVVCDACERMLLDSNAMEKLAQLQKKEPNVFEKFMQHIKDLLNKLRSLMADTKYTTEYSKELQDMEDVLSKFYELFENMAVDAVQNFQAAQVLETEAVSVFEDGTIQAQMKQYRETGRSTLLKYLREQYGDADANDLISTIDSIYNTMAEIKSDTALSVFGNWQETNVELDENGHPIFTTSINNGDYELNQDFSRVCKKRRQLNFVLNMLAKDPAFEASNLTTKDFVKINKAIKEHGFEIACALCFVDSKRFRQSEWADSFANTWNDILGCMKADSKPLTRFNFATESVNMADDGIEIDTSKPITFRKWSEGKVSEVRSYKNFDDLIKKNARNANIKRIATLIKDNPNLRHEFRGADIIASDGFDSIQRLAPEIRGILDGWGGTSVPKSSSNDAIYDNSILNLSGYNAKKAFAVGGVRMNSFSDFMAHMFFDYAQAFADLSAKQLPMHSYTKELDFARLFGLTGGKVNMSAIAAIRSNAADISKIKGKPNKETATEFEKSIAGLDLTRLAEKLGKADADITYDDVIQNLDDVDYVWADESINVQSATLLQSGILYDKLTEGKAAYCYELIREGKFEEAFKVAGEENVNRGYAKHLGIITVGVSKAHILKLLRDPTIRMVIPYHKSGLNAEVAKEMKIAFYEDFTNIQNTLVKFKGGKFFGISSDSSKVNGNKIKDFVFYDYFGKTVDGVFYDGKKTAEKYREWCEKGVYDEKVGDYVYYLSGGGHILASELHAKGIEILPKFYEFATEENYYKLIEDFDCYDTITGEHSSQEAVDMFHDGLPSDYKDVLVKALKAEQKVYDDFEDHLNNKGLKDEIMEIVKENQYAPSDPATPWEQGINIPTIDLGTELKFSKKKSVVDVNGNEYGNVVELNYKTFNKVRRSGKAYIDFIRKNMIKETITVYNDDGLSEVVQFAGENERIKKDGSKNPRRVLGELEQARDSLKKVVILNAVETAEISRFADHSDEHSHQWLDQNGWDRRVSYVMSNDGMIYPVTLHIAKTKDGRNILYDVNVHKNKGIAIDKNATSLREKTLKEQAVEIAMPSDDGIVSQPSDDVKMQKKRDSKGRELTEVQQKFFKNSSVVDADGNLKVMYHGSPNGEFTTFKVSEGSHSSLMAQYGAGYYFDENRESAQRYTENINKSGGKVKPKVFEVYLNVSNPLEITDTSHVVTKKNLSDVINRGNYEWFFTNGMPHELRNWLGKTKGEIQQMPRQDIIDSWVDMTFERASFDSDILSAMVKAFRGDSILTAMKDVFGKDGVKVTDQYGEMWVAWDSNQIKETSNENPTKSDDIRYQKKRNVEPVTNNEYQSLVNTFGTTQNYDVAGYLLGNGLMLDFSGKHWGNDRSTSRQVDHRDVIEGFGYDGVHSGNNGVDAMVDMIGNGNIRLMPEVGGINLAKAPNQSQIAVLRGYINHFRGEVVVDVDEIGGDTIHSFTYNRGTSSARILSDIKNYFENGTVPEAQSDLAQFRYQKKILTNRTILANALESAIDTSTQEGQNELSTLKRYQSEIAKIEALEQHLAEVNAEIKEISFGKGKRDSARLNALKEDKTKTANRINTHDRRLLRLEATKPLKDIIVREKEIVRKRAEKKGKEALAALREKNAETVREIMARNQESRKKNIENRHSTQMRHKVKGVVKTLHDYLTKGTKDKHVPLKLQKAVAEALDIVNMDTVGADERVAKYNDLIAKAKDPDVIASLTETRDRIQEQGDKMGEKIAKFKAAYADIQNSQDPDMVNAYDEAIANLIERVEQEVGNTPLRSMTLGQLEAVYDMYKAVLSTVRKANSLFKMERSESIATVANQVLAELDEVGKKKDYVLGGKIGSAIDTVKGFDWNNLKPVYAFERIGSNTLSRAYENVRKGEDTWAVDIEEAKAFKDAVAKKYHYDEWDFDKVYPFKNTLGQEFKLTLEQMLSLYAYSKRSQADEHLSVGGFVFNDSIEIRKEKDDGKKSILKYRVNTAKAHKVDKTVLAEIISTLSKDKDKIDFVDEMQDYLSTVMGAKGNEVSMALYDIKLYKEKNYFPLKSAQQYMYEQNQVAGEVRIKNSGFSKGTVPHARNPIILDNFLDVWANHVNDMAMYHAFVLPLEDFNRVFNYKTPLSENADNESVKAFIQDAYGSKADDYISQLLKDLNGGARVDPKESISKKMIGTFKKASVFASASVVIQQPSAVARALAIIDAKYFDFNPKLIQHNKLWSEVKKYAPVAIIKEMGHFDTDMGRSTVDYIKGEKTIMDKFDDFASKPAAYMDELTWCHIWTAVKREVMAKNKDLKGEDLLKKCGERFTEVVTKTQVYDSVLSRSANMRSKGVFMNMLTSFMAEPTTSINMLEDAITKWKRGSKGLATKQVGAVAASVILNSILVSLVYAARDDDEDETYAEKFLGSIVTEVIEGFNPITYYPIIKDVWSIMQGYDVERSDMSLISKAVDSLRGVMTVMEKDTSSTDEIVDAWVSLGGNFASIFGLPIKNIVRDVKAVFNVWNTANNGLTTSGSTLGAEVVESAKNAIPVWGWMSGDSKADKLYDAVVSGDQALIERAKAGYADEDKANSALKTAIGNHFKDGDIDADTAEEYLEEYLGMDEDDIYWQMDKWNHAVETGSSDGYTKYDDFITAVETGKNLKTVINQYIDNGVEKKTLASQITSHYKPIYKEMSNYERASLKGYLLNAYSVLGYDRSKKSKDIDKWLKED